VYAFPRGTVGTRTLGCGIANGEIGVADRLLGSGVEAGQAFGAVDGPAGTWVVDTDLEDFLSGLIVGDFDHLGPFAAMGGVVGV